jgi:hypothetical protein
VDLSLRLSLALSLGWRMIDSRGIVCGQSDVALALPAWESRGRDVVAVWAGAGLEEG